jgi:hypothetical protein
MDGEGRNASCRLAVMINESQDQQDECSLVRVRALAYSAGVFARSSESDVSGLDQAVTNAVLLIAIGTVALAGFARFPIS